MRLIDQILHCDKKHDASQALAELRRAFWALKPQCFEIDMPVVDAAVQVLHSKPSSVLSALCYARLPYPAIWIERRNQPEKTPTAADFEEIKKQWTPDNMTGLETERVGVLLATLPNPKPEAPPLSNALAIWAWSFAGGTICVPPISVLYDWHESLKAPDEIGPVVWSELGRFYHGYSGNEREVEAAKQLGTHALFMGCPISRNYWEAFGFPLRDVQAGGPYYGIDRKKCTTEQLRMADRAAQDLGWESSLITGFILLLNSPNALDQEREDLSQLNKSRRGKGKPPLTSGFIKTELHIPKHLRTAFGNSEAERAQARLHMVRGHFKVRKTGCYWWSPHPRGLGRPEAKREGYSVH